MKNARTNTTRKAIRILSGSIAALLAVHHAGAQTTIANGTTLSISDVANFISTAGAVTIEDNATLFISGAQAAPPAGHNITNNLILEGATVKLNFNNNDTAYRFTGTISSTATGAQTLKVSTGAGGNGDRQGIYFVSAIPDANGGASPLGLDLTYRTQSGSSSFVNLQGANTFTGPIAMHRNGPEVQRAYLVIGGQRHDLAFNANTFNTPGSGRLGAGGIFGGAILLDDTAMILNYNSTDNQTLSGAITGTGRLLLSGTGTLVLSGTNTYTGGTSFEGNGNNGTGSGGTLKMGAINALPTAGAVTVANLAGVAINLDGFNTQIGSLSGGGSTGGSMNLGSNAVLTVGNSTSTTYGGVISGTGTAGLVKNGSSTLTLSTTTAHTYTGATTINRGTLAIASNLASSAVTVGNGVNTATLALSTAAARTLGTNLTFNDLSTFRVHASGVTMASASVTGDLDVAGTTVSLKFTTDGTFAPAVGNYKLIEYGGTLINNNAWTLDQADVDVLNLGIPNKNSNWKNTPGDTDTSWDTSTNWDQTWFDGAVVYDNPNKRVNLQLTQSSTAPKATSLVTIAPTNAKAVTGSSAPATVASLTVGNGGANAHSLTLQSGGTLNVTGAVTVNGNGTVDGSAAALAAGTLNLSGGTVTVSAGSSAGKVNLTTGTLVATSGNELAVSNQLVKGTTTITAGTTPFKVGGSNVVSNIDKLMVQGGTTKLANVSYGTPVALVDTAAAWSTNNGTAISNSFTTSASANVLVVHVNWRATNINASSNPPALTYNGTPLIRASSAYDAGGGNWANASVYYLYNPTVGANALAVSFPQGGITDYAVDAFTLGNADTTFNPVTSGAIANILPLTAQATTSLTLNNIPTHGVSTSAIVYRTTNGIPASLVGTVTSGEYSGSIATSGPGGGTGLLWKANAAAGVTIVGAGMLVTDVTSSSLTSTVTANLVSARLGLASAAFAATSTVFAINQLTTELNVTGTNTLNLGASPTVTLGDLTFGAGGSLTLSNTPATNVSFNNLAASGVGTSTLAVGVPVSLRTGAANVGSGHTLTVSGAIIDGGTPTALNKTGSGTLTLSSAGNTYSGVTTVSAGVLRLNNFSALSSNSPLTLAGGVLGLGADDFTRGLGVTSADVQFTGSGGFAAYTFDRFVNLGGFSAGVTWNAGNFVPTGSALILGAADANKTVDFQNPIALGTAVRTIQVNDGSAATDAVVSNTLTGGAGGGVTKTGTGTLSLDGDQGYSILNATAGTTNVNGSLSTLTAAVTASNTGTKLRFGSVSQTLGSLTIGAGATVIFTSGTASGPLVGGGKIGASVVPEPGTAGLLFVGALGLLQRRRRST